MGDEDNNNQANQSGSAGSKGVAWSILLPAIAALLGAAIGAAGSTAATYLTLREGQSAEQRKLQTDAYLKFLDVASTSNDEITHYEYCGDTCKPRVAEMTKIDNKIESALNLVFIYGSYDTYTTANGIAGQLYDRVVAVEAGTPNTNLGKRYNDMRFKYLKEVCNEVNAIRPGC
jgi:hypothetical protein